VLVPESLHDRQKTAWLQSAKKSRHRQGIKPGLALDQRAAQSAPKSLKLDQPLYVNATQRLGRSSFARAL
jgi:hypothetical protein